MNVKNVDKVFKAEWWKFDKSSDIEYDNWDWKL